MQDANPFTAIVATVTRHLEQQAQAARLAAETAGQQRARLATIAAEQLRCLVLPILEAACAALQSGGIDAETSNGNDPLAGHPRRSLRLLLPGRTYPPALIFEAHTQSTIPALAWRAEYLAPGLSLNGLAPASTPIVHPDSVTVRRIIEKFITQATS